jgi:hypothetical protein
MALGPFEAVGAAGPANGLATSAAHHGVQPNLTTTDRRSLRVLTKPAALSLKWLLICAATGLAGCQAQDWRAQATAKAEDQMRQVLSDPAAQFSRVQVTGDNSTGQTCGFVTAKDGDGLTHIVRFIDYIDQSAGPYVEGGMGKAPLSQSDFDRAWQGDCVSEGYNAG